MGVNIFILDRRPVRVAIAGKVQEIGSLRRFFKITELNDARADELQAAEAVAAAMPSPKAAMLVEFNELPLGTADGPLARAHLVIGWEEGRTRVTDFAWDYLPTLGYAVRDADRDVFVLHEYRDASLHALDEARAIALGLIEPAGRLIRHGQPTISDCPDVRRFFFGYAEALCTFDDGRSERLLLRVKGDELPLPSWFIGKTPSQVLDYQP